MADWLAGRLVNWLDLLPKGRAGVWTTKSTIGIPWVRQKITNCLF